MNKNITNILDDDMPNEIDFSQGIPFRVFNEMISKISASDQSAGTVATILNELSTQNNIPYEKLYTFCAKRFHLLAE